MGEINFSTGVVDMSVNGVRTIRFNPSDYGYLEELFALASKVQAIAEKMSEKVESAKGTAKMFDYYRAAEKQMREAVDQVFGENFCNDVFQGVRLMATVDGLTVFETFLFAVVDKMDEDIKKNMSMRGDRINSYMEKYRKNRT